MAETPHSPTVLVVDDHDDNREMLADYLTFAGCTVATAATGAEAVAQAERMRPQVVLMDLRLGAGVDGWEATRIIKGHPRLQHTVVIAVTAHAFPPERHRAIFAGCHDVLVKPIDLASVAERVRRVASEREIRRVAPPEATHLSAMTARDST